MERHCSAPITNKTSIEIGYVGNHGTHVFKGNSNTYNANQATVAILAFPIPLTPSIPTPGCRSLTFNQRSPYNTAFTTSYTDANGVTTPVVCCSGQGLNYNGNDGSTLTRR